MGSICIPEYYKNSFYRDVYPACHTWINHIYHAFACKLFCICVFGWVLWHCSRPRQKCA